MATRSLPADSFGRAYLPEFLGYYGYPTTGFGYGMYAIPFAARDYDSVRREARASAQRLEQIKNTTPPSRTLDLNRSLEVAYRTAAEASYRLKDYSAADADIKRALEIHKNLPVRTPAEERDANDQIMLAAMITARMGRYADARQMIEPVVKFHRGLYARGKENEDLFQRVEFARALYVSALASQGQKAPELTQAAAIIDGLPPAMRGLISVTVLRDDIAEELKKQRG
jgi:tetratricopeptide (TPR) repeat protein